MDLSTCQRCEAGTHAPGEAQLLALIKADQQCVEAEVARGIASDHELLTTRKTHLHQGTGTLTWLIATVRSLSNNAFQLQLPDKVFETFKFTCLLRDLNRLGPLDSSLKK